MAERAALPDWPRRMTAPVAAQYFSVSTSQFLRRVQAGIYPAGHKDGRNMLWDRAELDRWADQWADSRSGGLKQW